MTDELYGLDCANPGCLHESMTGFRLDFWVRSQRPPAFSDDEWDRRRPWERERNPVVFRPEEYESAIAQLRALGVTNRPGLGAFLLGPGETEEIPYGYDRRRLILTATVLSKTALYFRWKPEAGEMLTPDNVFQCHFPPDSTAHERRLAHEVPISLEAFHYVTRRVLPSWVDSPIAQVTRESLLTCQHCAQPLPLRAFSTLTLRRIEKGD